MVSSYSQLLKKKLKGQLDAEGEQYIGFAVEGALRMERLLKGLRDYWAVNEEKVVQDVVADSNHTLQQALKILEARIWESGAVITHDLLPQ